MPEITPKQYAQALFEAVKETRPKDHDIVLDNFVKILADNGHLSMCDKIMEECRCLEMEVKGITQAEITLSRDMKIDSAIIAELEHIVKSKLELKIKVDEGIVGGMIVRIGDTLIDASVKTQLQNFRKTLDG